MGAAKFIGRVGGLAVALGVGTAAFAGQGIASADTGSSAGQDNSSAGTSSSASHSSKGSSKASSARSAGAARSSGNRGLSPRGSLTAAAASPDLPTADSDQDAPVAAASVTDSARVSVVAGSSRKTSVATPAAAPAGSVAGFLSAVIDDLLNPASGNGPGAPADAALSWLFTAFSRRDVGADASPTASATASAIFGNSIIVNPEVDWIEGILRGTLNASSTSGDALKFKVVSDPSLGGKIHIATSTGLLLGPGDFSYLPDQSTLVNPGLNEQFSIMVSEWTGFDQFMKNIPILGLFAEPIINFLYQVPVLNQLLAPIIGDSQIVAFNENPSTLADDRPVAFTYMMPSFDGTLISVNYFPATNVALGEVDEAPTVLNGPGLGSAGGTDPDGQWNLTGMVPGIAPLRTDAFTDPSDTSYDGGGGYNVVTWDPRGEFASGGILQLDSPFWEGRDTSAIISWLTSDSNPAKNQIKMESEDDPLIGMVGGSYGGGIQLATAGTPDKRIDAIVPTITWNNLPEALYPSDTFKTAWGDLLLLALVTTGARINTQIYKGILTGNVLGWLSETSEAMIAASGSSMLVNNIDIPTLLVQGTVDGLFTLNQAVTNSQQIATANPLTPNKMVWFCGGHGFCRDPKPQSQDQVINNLKWLDQYVAGTSTAADDIPNFTWYDQKGVGYASDLMPYDPNFNNADQLSFEGAGGNMLIVPVIGGSGPASAREVELPLNFTIPTEARKAFDVDIDLPIGTVIASAPQLSFTYQGIGTTRSVYAQLVDNATGRVVGNLVTPVSVTLDGRQHTVDIPMEYIAYSSDDPADTLTLQITSSATAYENFTSFGVINVSNINLNIATVADPQPLPPS